VPGRELSVLLSIEDFANPRRQVVVCEWLRDELHACVESAVMDNGVACVTRCVKHFQLRPQGARV
jgi:hypothetical protein